MSRHMTGSYDFRIRFSINDKSLEGQWEKLSFCFSRSARLKSEGEVFVMTLQDGVINTRWYLIEHTEYLPNL